MPSKQQRAATRTAVSERNFVAATVRLAQPLAKARLLEWLMLGLLLLGLVYAVKDAPGVTDRLRMTNPRLGAWWDAHQFHIIEGAATALGLAVGISVGRLLIEEAMTQRRCVLFATVFSLLALIPLVHLCEMEARLGWDASAEGIQGWLIGSIKDYEEELGFTSSSSGRSTF